MQIVEVYESESLIKLYRDDGCEFEVHVLRKRLLTHQSVWYRADPMQEMEVLDQAGILIGAVDRAYSFYSYSYDRIISDLAAGRPY